MQRTVFPTLLPNPASRIFAHSQPHFTNKPCCFSQFLRHVSPNCHTLYTSLMARFHIIYHFLGNSEVHVDGTSSSLPFPRCFLLCKAHSRLRMIIVDQLTSSGFMLRVWKSSSKPFNHFLMKYTSMTLTSCSHRSSSNGESE